MPSWRRLDRPPILFYFCSMGSRQDAAVETASDLGRARRVLRQQLDALSRLAAAAWRLIDPAPPAESAATIWAGVRNLEKALRLQTRVTWALRLIAALRAKLVSDLRTVENGQLPASLVEAISFAAESEPAETLNKAERPERPEPERPERERLRECERFSFQGRAADSKFAAILKRPTEEIIALICRELGLPADWPSLAKEAWAREGANGALARSSSSGARQVRPGRQTQDEGAQLRHAPRRTAPPSATPTFSSS